MALVASVPLTEGSWIALAEGEVVALTGEHIHGYLNIERGSLVLSGGVILFLISLTMIFRSTAEMFDDRYREDPFMVPIAVPSLAGPSAITTVMILHTQRQVDSLSLLFALSIVFGLTCAIFLVGRHINSALGPLRADPRPDQRPRIKFL